MSRELSAGGSILGQLHRAVHFFQCFRIFALLIQGERQAQNYNGSGCVGKASMDLRKESSASVKLSLLYCMVPTMA